MTTYERRKAKGLCPSCGSKRTDARFITCAECRTGEPYHPEPLPNQRATSSLPKWFIGLHEWMCQQGKEYAGDYQI